MMIDLKNEKEIIDLRLSDCPTVNKHDSRGQYRKMRIRWRVVVFLRLC
jgi:hypothetical protein